MSAAEKNIKSNRLLSILLHPAIGVTMVVVSLILGFVLVDESVPNDANIGAGILLTAGFIHLIAAGSHVYALRGTQH